MAKKPLLTNKQKERLNERFSWNRYREMIYGNTIKSDKDKDKHKVPDNIESEIKGIWKDKSKK